MHFICAALLRDILEEKNPRINHFKHASTNHLLPLQLIQKSKANFNKIKNSKKNSISAMQTW